MEGWRQLDAARGLSKIDLVLRNASLVNVFSGQIHITEIGIHQGKFVGVGSFGQASAEEDLQGKFVVPGLIDAHVHVESSHLCPEEFCSVLLAHGVTTAIMDPHEIANVFGAKGISYMLESFAALPFNAYLTLPSCVPATEMETSGARLEALDLQPFVNHPKVIGLGEVMNYQGVLKAEPGIIAKLELPLAFKDGHAPGIAPQDLNAYFLAGIHTDHECSTAAEALERLGRGYYLMLREGSAAKDLLKLLPAVNPENSRQCVLVTDDRHTLDLVDEGSVDHLVRLAISEGQPPVRAVQMATLNAAQALGLKNLGAVAPGYQADFLVLQDLNRFEIEAVYWRGQKQSKKGERPSFSRLDTTGLTGSVKLGNWQVEKLSVSAKGGKQAEVRVIGVQSHSLITKNLLKTLPVAHGQVLADPKQGIAKLAVLERHTGLGGVGVGFVSGLGLKKGAIASTVAHDSHNLVVAGITDREMDLAVRTCCQMGGGLCLVDGSEVIGCLPLPLAGLMTDRPAEEVYRILRELHLKAMELGVAPQVDPFMTLAFLSLPVIPELKLTDKGLIEVTTGSFADLLI